MKIIVTLDQPETMRADLIVVPLSSEAKRLPVAAAPLDKSLNGQLTKLIAEEKLTGKAGEYALLKSNGRVAAEKIMLLGAGARKLDAKAARKFAALAVQKARVVHAKSLALLIPDADAKEMAAVAEALTEGAILGDYRFLKYRSEEAKKHAEGTVEALALAVTNRQTKVAAEKGVVTGQLLAKATVFARELINEPASVTTPTRLMETARVLAAGSKRVSVKVFDRAQMEEMGMGGLLGVARGSDEPPYLVHLTYKPVGKAKRRIAVVGKGLTFDSGGLSLKPAEAMEDMKIDMSGAAAVLGVFSAIAEINPACEVHGIIGLCENMPSGKAVKPGDVLHTMSGKTVEILNTDAEGRITLADTLHYAQQQKPDYVIDLATLTGACMVALGQEVAGLMSNSRALADRLLSAADRAGELMWELPLTEEYRDSLKSRVADLKNITGTRYGGAITAGLFLQEFVRPSQAWAHLDIAGPAWAEKDTVPHQPIGGVGYGVRTVLRLIQNL
ncbi:MAG: leucyl aminopeptidase [Patescibacteria group bacterium]|nr:leucyl aminopeptidase [Patescibacteria group bacterium]